MFGQSTTPFGSPQGTGGFGTTNTAPAFGSPAPAPFGAPASGFGGGGTGFGSPAPASVGGFGSSTFGGAPSGGFGGGTSFGAPAPAAPTGFGTTTGGFGSTTTSSPFGAPAPAPSGGLFGNAPAPTGGLFGSGGTANTGFGAASNPSTGFGGSAATGGTAGSGVFGGTSTGFGAQPTSTFGTSSPAPTTGLFGAPAPAAPAFGSTGGFGTTNTTFGSPAPAPAGSLFGSPPATSSGLFGAAPAAGQAQGGGTKVTPFQVTNRQDGTNTITMQSITAMTAYESKSFEELRYEDYAQGNRGSSTTPAGGSFAFSSAPAPPGGLFGSTTPAPAPFGASASAPFGSSAPASFGAPAPAPFGSSSPAPFGAPAPAPFGAPPPAPFGAPAPAPFGAPATAFGSAFGSKPATGGVFGAPAPSGGLFGSSTAPAPAFGAPAPATGGLFGSAPSPAPGGLFGSPAPAPGGLFGSSPAQAPAFGAPAPAGGLFGTTPAPSGGLFGSPSPAPSFGTPAAGGLFGSTTPTTGLFGAKPPGTGLFGSPAPAPTGGLFGAPAPTPSGLFGAPPTAPVAAVAPPAGSIIPPAANEVLAHQLAALENKRKEIEKLDVWRGKSPESSALVPISLSESDSPSLGLLPSQQFHSPYRAQPNRSTAKVRPRGFASQSTPIANTSLNTMRSETRSMMSPDSFVASSVKRLVVKPGSLTPKPRMRLLLTDSPNTDSSPKLHDLLSLPKETVTSPEKEQEILSPETSVVPVPENGASPVTAGAKYTDSAAETLSHGEAENSMQQIVKPATKGSPSSEPGLDYYRKVITSPDAGTGVSRPPAAASFVPKLTKLGYEVRPSIEEMSSLSEADLAAVAGFSVRNPRFGMVQWEGKVDVRGADLDRVVDIAQNDVSVYMKDEEEGKKPEVGSKLNRPAVITFYNVFPKEGTVADDKTKALFAKKIEKTTKKLGAELISYDPDGGEWKIRVQHFSRYWLDEDTYEEEKPKKVTFQQDTFHHETIPGGSLVVGAMQDEEMEGDAAVVSDTETTDRNEVKIREDAEAAYEMMFGIMNDDAEVEPVTEPIVENGTFIEDGCFEEEHGQSKVQPVIRHAVSDEDYMRAATGVGICARICRKAYAGVATSSSTDFGLRMGRSFRVGWSHDGTFVRLCSTRTGESPSLVRCRPLFREGESRACHLRHLSTHKAHSIMEPNVGVECPRYVLQYALEDKSSAHCSLYKTISSYAGMNKARTATSEEDVVVDRAFSLLLCLLDSNTANSPRAASAVEPYDEQRRNNNGRMREAICRWLVDSCERDSDEEIERARQRDDAHSAVFAALSGGDLEKASSIAIEMGQVHLGVLLASGVEGQRDVMEQLRVWQESGKSEDVPDQLLRIYRLIAGELKMEGKLYEAGKSTLDWRRHLVMRMSSVGPEQNVADIIHSYNSDVITGVAPFPYPRYFAPSKQNKKIQCVLYRILRLVEEPQVVSLLEIIDPLGLGRFAHDYSFSFHLAAVLTVMGICPPLSTYDEFRLSESYQAQLVSQGCWDAAVYVSLCSSGSEDLQSSQWKVSRAKDLLLQNLNPSDPQFSRRLDFLQEIGVPSKWIEEALALRYTSGSDPFQYISHLKEFSSSRACEVVDDIIIPNLLFMNYNDVERSLKLFDCFAGEMSPMGRALFRLFELCKDIDSLGSLDQQHIEISLPTLYKICDEIEMTLKKRLSASNSTIYSNIGFQPPFRMIPLHSMVTEAMEHVTFLRLQLKALESGIPIADNVTDKKLPAQLAFSTLSEYDERFSTESRIVAGLR